MTRFTTVTSVTLAILKQLRLTNRILQKEVAKHLGKTTSAYTKIEKGQSELSYINFLKICEAVKAISPGVVIQHTSLLIIALSQNGWCVKDKLSENEKDDLIDIMETFTPQPISHSSTINVTSKHSLVFDPQLGQLIDRCIAVLPAI